MAVVEFFASSRRALCHTLRRRVIGTRFFTTCHWLRCRSSCCRMVTLFAGFRQMFFHIHTSRRPHPHRKAFNLRWRRDCGSPAGDGSPGFNASLFCFPDACWLRRRSRFRFWRWFLFTALLWVSRRRPRSAGRDVTVVPSSFQNRIQNAVC